MKVAVSGPSVAASAIGVTVTATDVCLPESATVKDPGVDDRRATDVVIGEIRRRAADRPVTGRAYAVDAPAARLITNVAVLLPSSAAVASVAATVASGSSAIVAVAAVPSTVKITVSAASAAGSKIGVTVTVTDVWPTGIATVKLTPLLTSPGPVMS